MPGESTDGRAGWRSELRDSVKKESFPMIRRAMETAATFTVLNPENENKPPYAPETRIDPR